MSVLEDLVHCSACKHKQGLTCSTHTENTHLHACLTRSKPTCIHTPEWWNSIWLVLPTVKPSDTSRLPFLSFSNNIGLTSILLRAHGSSQQIKDNLNLLIHVTVFSLPSAIASIIIVHYNIRVSGGSPQNEPHKRLTGYEWGMADQLKVGVGLLFWLFW